MAMEMLKTLAVLVLVIGLILALAYVGRRFGLRGASTAEGQGGWRILSVKSLGPRRQVFIVEVGTRILLVGVTDKMMTPLMEITDPEERSNILVSIEKSSHKSQLFAQFLKRAEA